MQLTNFIGREHEQGEVRALLGASALANEQADYPQVAVANLAEVLRYQGDYARARPLYGESLAILARAGNRLGIVECLEGLAAIARGTSHLERTARLWGAAEVLSMLIGAAQQPADRTDYERHVAALRRDLAEAVLVTAWAEGGGMTVEQAVAYASESGQG